MLQPWSWYDHMEDESRSWKEFQLIGIGQINPSRIYFFEKSFENEKKPREGNEIWTTLAACSLKCL